jgi:NAD(P)-dependent dehydrogenase (short-subunit alcohol dehydrogenase family)
MSSFAGFVKDQYTTLPIIPTPQDCKGKTYVVTGANTGLGYECAKHLIRLEAKKVILSARSLSKAEATKTKIEAETGTTGVAEVWELELGSYDSVKRFSEKVKGLDRVDAIIENASIALDEWTTSEGLETSLTVNVVGTFLLALKVLPKLQDTAKRFGIETHLVVVGSEVAFDAKGEFEKIDGDILDGLNQGIMGKR